MKGQRLLGAIAATGVALALLVGALVPVQIVIASVILVGSGWLLVAALLPGSDLGLTERLTLSVGASMASVVVMGQILHLTPWGLSPLAWRLAIALFGLVAAFVAWRRRARVAPVGTAIRPGVVGSVLVLTAVVVSFTAVSASADAMADAERSPLTQLWMLPAEAGDVKVGVESLEDATTSYRLDIVVDGTWRTRGAIVRLRPGERWDITVPSADLQGAERVDAVLFRDGSDTPYRAVFLDLGLDATRDEMWRPGR